jgi:hypothetical protein
MISWLNRFGTASSEENRNASSSICSWAQLATPLPA